MDIEKELEGGVTVTEYKAATTRESVRELRKEFPLTESVMRVFEARGIDTMRWGIEKVVTKEPVMEPVLDDDGKPVLGEDGEPQEKPKVDKKTGKPEMHEVVTYNGATFVMRELRLGEMKKAGEGATEVELEKTQIDAALVRFGKMDVAGMIYECDYIRKAGGTTMHILMLACSNSLMFPGGQFQDIGAAVEAARLGKFL